MKIIALLIIIILSACTSTPTPEPKQVIAPRETVSPSPVPSPTLDYLATAQAERDTAVNAADAARRAELDAQQGEIYAVQTAQSANVEALRATMTLGAQSLEIASLRVTEDMLSATRQSAAISDWQNRATATAQAPALMLAVKQAEGKAQAASMNALIEPWLKLLTLISIIGAISLIGIAIVGRQPPQIVTVEKPLPVTHITRGTVTEVISPPECTSVQWDAWSRWMLGGGSAALDEWEYSGSPFRGSEYRLGIYKWAVKNKMIAIVNRAQVLTDRGREYCQAHLTPSPDDNLAQ